MWKLWRDEVQAVGVFDDIFTGQRTVIVNVRVTPAVAKKLDAIAAAHTPKWKRSDVVRAALKHAFETQAFEETKAKKKK
jgi:hypothetical protein